MPRVIRSLIVALIVPWAASCSSITAQNRETVELWLRAGSGAKSDPRVVEVSRHCCCSGEIALARVSQLPLPGATGPLESELVVELSDAGVVLTRWPLPADLVVAGVKNEQLLVSLAPMGDFERGIFISPRGILSMTTVPKESPEPRQHTCPRIPEFGDSAYLRCFEFRDLGSGAIRRLAYEGVCT